MKTYSGYQVCTRPNLKNPERKWEYQIGKCLELKYLPLPHNLSVLGHLQT